MLSLLLLHSCVKSQSFEHHELGLNTFFVRGLTSSVGSEDNGKGLLRDCNLLPLLPKNFSTIGQRTCSIKTHDVQMNETLYKMQKYMQLITLWNILLEIIFLVLDQASSVNHGADLETTMIAKNGHNLSTSTDIAVEEHIPESIESLMADLEELSQPGCSDAKSKVGDTLPGKSISLCKS